MLENEALLSYPNPDVVEELVVAAAIDERDPEQRQRYAFHASCILLRAGTAAHDIVAAGRIAAQQLRQTLN